MKRLIAILTLMMVPFLVSAQIRIRPMWEVNQSVYDEAIKLITMMERSSFIERMEGVKLDTNKLSTSYGEILLEKEGNSIKVMHGEFTAMIEKHLVDPRYRSADTDSIRTELIIQNARFFEYLFMKMEGNSRVKNMYIQVDPRTGAAFIRINYHRL